MAEMVKATLNGQYEIILPKHRADRPEWYTEKGWEKTRLERLHIEIAQQIHQGIQPVVYYVGAEEGEMAALCQMWGAEVVLFEPNDRVWPNIKAIWDANGLEAPLGIFPGFASNETKNGGDYAVLTKAWPLSADGEVIGDHGFKELHAQDPEIPQITIDRLGGLLHVRPTIITFDCEGSDWELMRGAAATLAVYKPTIFASIHPEFMFNHYGQYSGDFRKWLRDFGYDEELLDYQHECHFLYTKTQ